MKGRAKRKRLNMRINLSQAFVLNAKHGNSEMKARKLKSNRYPRRLNRTKEEQAWLNMRPVGREFGSPDYDKLIKFDGLPESIKTRLIAQVRSMLAQSGILDDFDEELWLARWLFEPLPALGGQCPSDYLDSTERLRIVATILATMQSGAYF